MKLDSINGKGTGKSGSSVYYVSHGVQVQRSYTSQVANPNTEAQVAQRSRFKLISQVSAAVEPVIIIPRKGLQSPRNLFVKKNMGYVYATEDGAQVSYENLQISPGSNGLPQISIARRGAGALQMIDFGFTEPVGESVSRAVFCFFVKGDDGSLVFIRSEILETPSPSAVYGKAVSVDVFPAGKDIIVLAYGIKDKNKAATAKFGDYHVETAQDIAKLVANRKMSTSDYTFTQTRGATLYYGEASNVTPSGQTALLYITCLNGSTVSVQQGGGEPETTSGGVFDVQLGGNVTLQSSHSQTEANGSWVFLGWCNNGSQEPFSVANPLTFTMNGLRDIVAKWAFSQYAEGLE